MPAQIYVIAGVNGAGKSSIGGAALLAQGAPYYNPDLAERRILDAQPGLDVPAANAQAWELGRAGLERALRDGLAYAFETTLGARTITDMLIAGAARGAALAAAAGASGAAHGAQVHLWYAGLASPELHIQRVRERVAAGGHDIPETTIRARCESSRANLIRLLPHLASLRVFDNSLARDPKAGLRPEPRLLLQMQDRRILDHLALQRMPAWAKPIVAAALLLHGRH